MPKHNTNAGFTLLEVMIALVIFSIGLLGLAGLQAGGLRSTTTAQYRTIATILAYDMAERLRANPRGVSNGGYDALDDTSPTAGDCVSNSCDADAMATYDYYEWQKTASSTLPGGHGAVARKGATNQFTISVMWDEERTGTATKDCTNLKCYQVVFEP